MCLFFSFNKYCHTVSSSNMWYFPFCIWLGVYWYITVYLICIFLIANEVKHLFTCWIVIWVSSFWIAICLLRKKLLNFLSYWYAGYLQYLNCEFLVLYPSIYSLVSLFLHRSMNLINMFFCSVSRFSSSSKHILRVTLTLIQSNHFPCIVIAFCVFFKCSLPLEGHKHAQLYFC